MLSAGIFTSLAAAMIVRRRGFMLGSPPPLRAATVSSLMMRVKILPRLASAAPFLCLIVCHLEWPDMWKAPEKIAANECGPISLHREVGMTNGLPGDCMHLRVERTERSRYSVAQWRTAGGSPGRPSVQTQFTPKSAGSCVQ